MLSHSLEQGVLVITVHEDPGIDGRATLLTEISGLLHAHKPAPIVIVLDESAAGDAAVSVVLRVHRLCNHLGLLMSVVTHSAPARRLLETNALTGSMPLVVYARADTAIATALIAAA